MSYGTQGAWSFLRGVCRPVPRGHWDILARDPQTGKGYKGKPVNGRCWKLGCVRALGQFGLWEMPIKLLKASLWAQKKG